MRVQPETTIKQQKSKANTTKNRIVLVLDQNFHLNPLQTLGKHKEKENRMQVAQSIRGQHS